MVAHGTLHSAGILPSEDSSFPYTANPSIKTALPRAANSVCTVVVDRQKQLNNHLAELCSGSTADSDSVCLGSNPSSAAIKNTPLFRGVCSLLLRNFVRAQFLTLWARIGFAFERKLPGSLLTSSEAKILVLRLVP